MEEGESAAFLGCPANSLPDSFLPPQPEKPVPGLDTSALPSLLPTSGPDHWPPHYIPS
jgi:hypothetical protein